MICSRHFPKNWAQSRTYAMSAYGKGGRVLLFCGKIFCIMWYVCSNTLVTLTQLGTIGEQLNITVLSVSITEPLPPSSDPAWEVVSIFFTNMITYSYIKKNNVANSKFSQKTYCIWCYVRHKIFCWFRILHILNIVKVAYYETIPYRYSKKLLVLT